MNATVKFELVRIVPYVFFQVPGFLPGLLILLT